MEFIINNNLNIDHNDYQSLKETKIAWHLSISTLKNSEYQEIKVII